MRSLIQAFDTSTDVCTVSLLALGGNEPVVASRSVTVGRGHTRLLLGYCDEVLAEACAEPGDIAALLVGTGPGTFTGVRIGIATARGVALSVGCPVAGVATLAALVASVADDAPDIAASVIVPVVDARRGQLFAGVYVRHPVHGGVDGGCWVRTGDYFCVDPSELALRVPAHAGEAALLVGDPRLISGLPLPGLPVPMDAAFLLRGQSRLREPAGSHGGADLAPWLAGALCRREHEGSGGVTPDRPLPGAIAPGEWGSPEAVHPLYIRMPDADVHITRMKDPWAS